MIETFYLVTFLTLFHTDSSLNKSFPMGILVQDDKKTKMGSIFMINWKLLAGIREQAQTFTVTVM